MGRASTVATHPQKEAIDRMFREGKTLAEMNRLFGLSTASLHRYRKSHFLPTQRQAQFRILEAHRTTERKIRQQLVDTLVDAIALLVDQLRLAQEQVREQELLAKTNVQK